MSMSRFLQEFALNPTNIGAIAPSSSFLAKEIVSGLELGSSNAVLEYGPGTGAFTPYILGRISRSCKFMAIELNPRFIGQFRARFPGVTLHEGSVAHARQICDEHNISVVDCIVCGLPWAAF